ncbi:pyruvate, phosphate dikinase/phosphoenolpyruvate synthase regulator [Sneathiella sp. P13V-1]|uniref:pyruvate, water dikinase regulatory protein n=1 Tax=Sneathiella sp. P13V-1 TaxID=2697366 RepID=UPI00187BB11D|nr:pyruvate, water dikinase regulatory protein [Sneathiella sp. P13V-1]MBE7636072.1 pyruvate, phosphate dikinase/phosphoenolpyruvate synthase regulator [Sneathiella sp. P13V-1]
MGEFHLHLVSDSTGETLQSMAKASLVQFESAVPIEHVWSMTRTVRQLDDIIDSIKKNPGLVLFTLVNKELRGILEKGCRNLGVPCVSVLDPVLAAFSQYLGQEARNRPGRQHALDQQYFARIEALNYTMAHDDGQMPEGLEDADIVLVGVSRTSKTPTSFYLSHRGIKTANVPIVLDCPLPDQLFHLKNPFVVGLTTSPDRLSQIRKNRLLSLQEKNETSYVDLERIKQEVIFARKLCTKQGWPIIDVSRRSVEETAAQIITLYNRRFTDEKDMRTL